MPDECFTELVHHCRQPGAGVDSLDQVMYEHHLSGKERSILIHKMLLQGRCDESPQTQQNHQGDRSEQQGQPRRQGGAPHIESGASST